MRPPMLPVVHLAGRADDGVEPGLIQDGALAPNLPRIDPDDPVETDLARAPVGVPRPGSDVHPVPPPARLVRRVAVVVLAGEHEAEQPGTVATDEQDGAILAMLEVLL